MFEKATRLKMRFPYKGMISVEDLWDLNIEELDSVYKTLNGSLTRTNEVSLLKPSDNANDYLMTQINIVKYIFETKVQEAAEVQRATERNMKKQKLMELIVAKQDAELSNKSVEELQEMLDDLD